MARGPDVALLMTASGSLDIFLTRLLRMKLFRNFLQSHQKHHAAPEVELTVRSRLLKRKFRHLPLFKILDFAYKCTSYLGKLVALSVEKYYVALTEIAI